jgi:uncharacterized repeat protein (TIGR01451 family)
VGGSGTIIVNGTVQSPLPNGTILNNRVRLSDTFGNAITAEQNTAVTSNPTLGIALADDRDPATAGGDLVFTVSYSNTGNANASAAVVTATYDPNVTFVSASPAPDPSTNNRWTLGTSSARRSDRHHAARGGVLRHAPHHDGLDRRCGVRRGPENTIVSSAPALGVSILDALIRSAGGGRSYTITYANTGTDVLPPRPDVDPSSRSSARCRFRAPATISGRSAIWHRAPGHDRRCHVNASLGHRHEQRRAVRRRRALRILGATRVTRHWSGALPGGHSICKACNRRLLV